MDNGLPIRQPSLSDQVYEIIMKAISNGTYPSGSLLPSENQLAEQFNVSRPTVRSAFARLMERGYVNRQRGVGTFVAELPGIMDPLYLFQDVRERIALRGYKSGFFQLDSEIIPANDSMSKKLDVLPGSNLLHITKVFTADDDPIIYFDNYIPEWVYGDSVSTEEALAPGATEPFFEFFACRCNNRVKYLRSIIKPSVVKDADLPDVFNVMDPNGAFLLVHDTGYSEGDVPVFFSYEHLFGEASSTHIMRHVENM
jgi:DNA-binding GntR family transcriptional regulator